MTEIDEPRERLVDRMTRFITSIDVFGQPARFVVDGKPLQISYFGGLMTLLIALVISLYSYNAFKGYADKKKFTFQETQSFDIDPPILQLDKSRFMFAVGITDPLITSNSQAFSYMVTNTQYIKTDNGSSIIEEIIPLRPCLKADFSGLETEFDLNHLQNLFCPEIDKFNISGTFTSPLYQFIKINVTDCINNTISGISCASPDFITTYLASSNKIRIDLYYINNIIHLGDFNTPLMKFLDNLDWIITTDIFAKTSEVFLKEVNIITKDNIFGTKEDIVSAHSFNNEQVDQILLQTTGIKEYLTIYLRKSPYLTSYTRQYETIDETLASIGGIWNVFYLILGAIAGYYNRIVFALNLANHLYDFEVIDNTKDDPFRRSKTMQEKENQTFGEINRTLTIKNEISLVNLKENSGNSQYIFLDKQEDNSRIINMSKQNDLNQSVSPPMKHQNYEKKMRYLKDLFRVFKKKRSGLMYSFSDLLSLMLFGYKKSKRMKNKLLHKANTQISKEIDIANILTRLREVEKLKHVFFNKDQLAMFNFTPRPIVHSQDSITKKSFLVMKTFDTDSLDGYLEAYQYFKILEENETRINSKILNLIDLETLSFFSKFEKLSPSINS